MASADARSKGWPHLSPWLVLAVGLVATTLMVQAAHQRAQARDATRFERVVGRTLLVIRRGLDTDDALLRGTAGLFAADPAVDADAFHAYVASLDLKTRYPGVRGIGFAKLLDPKEPGSSARARAWPDAAKAGTSILFLEPPDPQNQRTVGFDMSSEPTRAVAMAMAREQRRTVASGLVRLIQRPDGPGIIIYHPVFVPKDGRFLGWAYMPLRAADFFGANLRGAGISELVNVAIFDGPPAAGRKLYEVGPRQSKPRFSVVRSEPAFGRAWSVRVATGAGFAEGPWSDAVPVAIASLALTFAVTFAFWLQAHALSRAIGAEEEARAAQARTEVLLTEVNHRVANSLQVVASLLDLQHEALKDRAARAALVETKARIMAVARVHQRLFGSDDVGRVDLKGYLESLAAELATTLDADGRRLKLIGAEVSVDAGKAVSAGIVVAELVTNAFKYAYAQGIAGEVRIRLAIDDGQVWLSVEDDGVGFPARGAGPRGTGLGMRIVRAMTQTLDGALDMGPIGGGARVTLIFPSS